MMTPLWEKSAINPYQSCTLCPRECRVDRTEGRIGVCGASDRMKIARCALHFWEEPCISADRGSGAVFFSGCSLHCIYCQNYQISGLGGRDHLPGIEVEPEELAQRMLQLQAEGANNINLVTGAHYVPGIKKTLEMAKNQGLTIPIVYNSSGYEQLSTLRELEGLVDIWLPDFKYMDAGRARTYSSAPDYPERAKEALAEMVRQQPEAVFLDDGQCSEVMQKGVIVRHLLLPGGREDTFAVLRYLYETYKDRIYISIMRQYTPIGEHPDHPELDRKIRRREYERVLSFAMDLGITNAFIQEGGTAKESFIPGFLQN